MRTPILFALPLLVACEPADDPSELAAALPDERILISMPTDLGGGARDGDLAEAALFTAQITSDVNGLIGGVLATVDAATDFPATWHDTMERTAVWGPWESDAVDTVLWVQHDPSAELPYTWVIGQRDGASESWDDFVPIIVGEAAPGETDDTGSGWFFIDFDAAASLDPSVTARGRFANEYDLRTDGVSAEAGFEQFSDGGEPVDAWYRYEQTYDGEGQMDLAYRADVNPESGTGKLEDHAVRSRWQPDGAGRADAYVGGGDLEDLGFVGMATECWTSAFERTWYVNNWDPESEEGDVASCVYEEPEFEDE